MIYDLLELQRSALKPLSAWLRLAGDQLGVPSAAALGTWLDRSLGAGTPLDRPIEAAVAASMGRPISARRLFETPFVRVVRLTGSGPGVNVLLAPHSGYAASVLHRVAASMLEVGDVLVTEWVDARLVPTAAGRLGLVEQTEITAAAIAAAGPGAGVVAVSQAGIAAVRALGLVPPSRTPLRLCLLGAPIDPRIDPAPAQRLVTSLPDALLAEHLLLSVPAGHAGEGRKVFAALLQLLSVASTTPAQYAEIQGGLLLELLGLVRMGYDRQHEDLHALVDVPAELFLDLVSFLRAGSEQAVVAGLGLDRAIAETPVALLTVEAAADALVGPGQTHAALNLLRPAVLHHERHSLPSAAHHDLFVGPRFERLVRPSLVRFLA